MPGKLEVRGKVSLRSREDLAEHYTPGVGRLVKAIAEDKGRAWDLTIKGESVAIISNGSAVLGFGNLGPLPMLPVLEGKGLILKEFSGLNPFPLAVDGEAPEVVEVAKAVAPTFAAIMVEDVKSPECFYVQQELTGIGVPVFNDDMYGSAIVSSAALLNALERAGKGKEAKIVIVGAGAAGLTTAMVLHRLGFRDVWVFDSKGLLHEDREDLHVYKKKVAFLFRKRPTTLREALRGADVFIGFSKGEILRTEDVKEMADKAIVFAMANPVPEISKEEALKAGNVSVYANGRSDCEEQINNAVAFPGIMKGLVDGRAKAFKEDYIPPIVEFIASYARERGRLVPDIFDRHFHGKLAAFVKELVEKG